MARIAAFGPRTLAIFAPINWLPDWQLLGIPRFFRLAVEILGELLAEISSAIPAMVLGVLATLLAQVWRVDRKLHQRVMPLDDGVRLVVEAILLSARDVHLGQVAEGLALQIKLSRFTKRIAFIRAAAARNIPAAFKALFSLGGLVPKAILLALNALWKLVGFTLLVAVLWRFSTRFTADDFRLWSLRQDRPRKRVRGVTYHRIGGAQPERQIK